MATGNERKLLPVKTSRRSIFSVKIAKMKLKKIVMCNSLYRLLVKTDGLMVAMPRKDKSSTS